MCRFDLEIKDRVGFWMSTSIIFFNISLQSTLQQLQLLYLLPDRLQWCAHTGGISETSTDYKCKVAVCLLHKISTCLCVQKITEKSDLPGTKCWVVRWEESPGCAAAERIPSRTWGTSTSPALKHTLMMLRWDDLSYLTLFKVERLAFFLTPSGLAMLTAACEIITR